MSTYLMHHGIKGMKWGVRRYQNEDGTLTEAGRARYGGQEEHSDNLGRRLMTGNTALGNNLFRSGGRRAARQNAVNTFERKSQQAEYEGNSVKADKYRRKAEAQRAANANRDAYDRHTSTGKMLAQNLMMTPYGAERYRDARARGEGRLRSLFEANLAYTPVGYIVRRQGNKEAYGENVRVGEW